MGNKVNPRGIRLGITTDWKARWYAEPKDYARMLHADLLARGYLEKELKPAGVSTILIERLSEKSLSQAAKIIAFVARPGVVIGKKGRSVEDIKQVLERTMGIPVNLSIKEIRKPELDAKLVAKSIADQLTRRVMFKRAMKRAIDTTMRAGALGVRIVVSGRLGGAEIARRECNQKGRMPFHTFRAKIDHDFSEARTNYGSIGIKVSIFLGEVFSMQKGTDSELMTESIHPQVQKARQRTSTRS